MSEALIERITASNLTPEARALAKELARVLGQEDAAPAEIHHASEILDRLLALPWADPAPPPQADPEVLAEAIDTGQYAPSFFRRILADWLLTAHLDRHSANSLLIAGPAGSGRRTLIEGAAAALELPSVTIDLVGSRSESDLFGQAAGQARGSIGSLARALAQTGERRCLVILANVNWAIANWPDHGTSLLALLIDRQARSEWRDNYLDVAFDLSATMFAITADGGGSLPPEVVERLTVIDCPGYTRGRRVEITRNKLWNQISDEFGLGTTVELGEDAAGALVNEFAPEAGFSATALALREIARRMAAAPDSDRTPHVDAQILTQMLGKPRAYYRAETAYARPGMCRSLLLGPQGASVQVIEAVPVPGGRYYLSPEGTPTPVNKIFDTAYYYVRSRMTELDISARQLYEYGYKINHTLENADHDVESLSLAVLVALVSVLRDRPVDAETAVIGEMNQNGMLMGGIGLPHRLLAAQRSGLRRVILPRANAFDIEDLPPGLENDMTLVMVADADQAIRVALS